MAGYVLVDSIQMNSYTEGEKIVESKEQEPTLEIVKALIACQVCGHASWYKIKNERQNCPHCGMTAYRHTIAQMRNKYGTPTES